MHRSYLRWYIILLLPLVVGMSFLAPGCTARRAERQPLPLDEAWQRAKSYFERERYLRAQRILHDIVLSYSGSAIIDSAQFLLARTSFEMGDYLVASDEFHRVVEQYPSSPLVGAAVYYEARSLYEQSPAYQLDQEYTEQAIQGFQRFLEDYPTNALADSGYYYLAEARTKLARKLYSAATLYYDLHEYASAVLYADLILDNYYDTSLAGSAQYLKGRSYFALKSWDRARDELQTYLQKYPNGPLTSRARDMLSIAQRNAGTSAATAAP